MLGNVMENAITLLAPSAIPTILVGRQPQPGALAFLKIHAAVFTALMGLALLVFAQRAATDPWWPHPMLVPFLALAVLAWVVEVLALPAIVYAARSRGGPAEQPSLFPRTLTLAAGIGVCAILWSMLAA